MDEGQHYWNEETQRWESGAEGPRPAVPPPPPRPEAEWPTLPAGLAPPPDAPRIMPPPGTEPGWSGTEPGWSDPASGTEPGWSDPPPGRGRRKRTTWVSLLIGAATAGLLASLTVALVADDGDGDGDESGGRGPGASAPAATSTGPSAAGPSPAPSGYPGVSPAPGTPSPAGTGPAAGYLSFDDPEGFRIAVPPYWDRTAQDSEYGIDVVDFRSPGGDRKLQVFEVAESSPDESFRLLLSDSVPKPDGFVQRSLENLDDGLGFTGTMLEYTADSLAGEAEIGRWHVYDLRFVAADGNIYALAAYGPDAGGADGSDDELALLDAAFSWFCPPGTTCSA
ncbi:hypothetical protein [Streptomyces ziwulingensis]|uniref:Serine/arginine repetitive matrix protein 2 n=1 Tax=Streptomyces ziwulingensis TaxID=1045501 RepID=A0ABP9C7P9_9ACTN